MSEEGIEIPKPNNDNDDKGLFDSMFEEPITTLTCLGLFAAFLVSIPFFHRIDRTRGSNPLYHGGFVLTALLLLLLVPDSIQNVVLSQGGVLIIGTLLPVYESIVAVCTIGETDDTAWLQYWITSATFTYATEFMDVIAEKVPGLGEHWYELEFFFMVWLILPFTDGAALIYDKFTGPCIAPLCQAGKAKMEGWMGLVMAAVNSSYLWIVWLSFMTLPEEARRFVTVAVGTVYPLVASTVAITTESDVKDDTYWLTYWSCYSLLFIAMDYLENFIGSIRGFYSICLCATVYLFLPMFRGAEAVFRNVLVPLSGQYENMLLRDTYMVRLEMESKIPQDYHTRVLGKAADVFLKKKEQIKDIFNDKKKD